MQTRQTHHLSQLEKQEIRNIWNTEYPEILIHDTLESFETYLNKLDHKLHYLVSIDDMIAGWACSFEREHDKWFVIIINSNHQKMGIGKKLMNTLKHNNTALNGWVIDQDTYLKEDGTIYNSPIGFYQSIGFDISRERKHFGKFEAVKIKWVSIEPH